MCFAKDGLFYVSKCSNVSPSMGAGASNGSNFPAPCFSCRSCPGTEACAFNIGLAFWLVRVGHVGGVMCSALFFTKVFLAATYDSCLRINSPSVMSSSFIFSGPAATHTTLSNTCRR